MADSKDYPVTQQQFERRFSSEDSCVEYLISIRWPDGPRCPKCGGGKFWRTGLRLICSNCRHHIRVLAGSMFQDTHLPLTVWFRVIWFFVFSKQSASAMTLQKLLGVSYKAMWNVLHKLRRAMVRPGRDRLSGRVEVDETYIGGVAEGKPGRGAEKKALVVVAVEKVGTASIGGARMKVIDRATAENLIGFIEESIEPGSTVITDGWPGYSTKVLKEKGYTHELDKPKPDQDTLPCVHRVISLLKRVLLGTYQGAVSHHHLGFYLDEYVFRFNRRKSMVRGLLFRRLLESAVQVPPTTWKDLAGKPRKKAERSPDDLEDEGEAPLPHEGVDLPCRHNAGKDSRDSKISY